MELAKKIFDKISEYDILNTVIPGATLSILLGSEFRSFSENLAPWQVLTLIYILGLIVGRFGSIIIEKFLRCLVKHAEYSDYLAAEEKDPKLKALVTHNNLYRSLISTGIVAGLFRLIEVTKVVEKVEAPDYVLKLIALVIFSGIFIMAYIKQTKYIVARVEKNKGRSATEQPRAISCKDDSLKANADIGPAERNGSISTRIAAISAIMAFSGVSLTLLVTGMDITALTKIGYAGTLYVFAIFVLAADMLAGLTFLLATGEIEGYEYDEKHRSDAKIAEWVVKKYNHTMKKVQIGAYNLTIRIFVYSIISALYGAITRMFGISESHSTALAFMLMVIIVVFVQASVWIALKWKNKIIK